MSLNLDSDLLETLFETISNDVHVFEAVRNSDHIITDFKSLIGNKTTGVSNGNLYNKLFDQFVNVIETGEPLDMIFQDQDRWHHVRAQKFNNVLIVYREDITVAKQAEEKIMQLNMALFAKNRKLEVLSSELKTFNTIAANDYNETLKHLYNSMEFIINNDAKNLSDAGKANIRRAQAAIQKTRLLTDDIIAFSKIHPDEQMTEVDLNEILVAVLNSLDEKIKAANAKISADKLPTITGYPPLVSLLFHHLISNALKFRKDELYPVIDIRHSVKRGSEIEHSAVLTNDTYNLISVIDNGIGFDPQEGEKIFTMFYRLHEKGKQKGGIGLAICKKIMDLHGGFIASECTPECTTFKCYFPI
ncbi:MAG TPA: ATP-binding protein [Chitinophagaceae bacterium]|nr:ATP-binding protein [Chitinophagaceae bacterium]